MTRISIKWLAKYVIIKIGRDLEYALLVKCAMIANYKIFLLHLKIKNNNKTLNTHVPWAVKLKNKLMKLWSLFNLLM